MNDDTYVYVSVKLYLKDGQTEDSIQEIIQELDYSFSHEQIRDHEIRDIVDFQIPDVNVVTNDLE
jgi:hypothetical protein